MVCTSPHVICSLSIYCFLPPFSIHISSFTHISLPPSLPPSQFDDRKAVYDGNFVAEDIDSFILQEQLPLVTIFSDEVSGVWSHGLTHTYTGDDPIH